VAFLGLGLGFIIALRTLRSKKRLWNLRGWRTKPLKVSEDDYDIVHPDRFVAIPMESPSTRAFTRYRNTSGDEDGARMAQR